MNETRVDVRNVPSLISAFQSVQQDFFVYQTASSPWIGFIMEHKLGASPGVSLPLVSKSDQAGQHWNRVRPQRKEVSLRRGETPRQRAERRTLLSAALSLARCFNSLPFWPSLGLTSTLEGLPPKWSLRRSPVFSYWLLCLTANSNSQSGSALSQK